MSLFAHDIHSFSFYRLVQQEEVSKASGIATATEVLARKSAQKVKRTPSLDTPRSCEVHKSLLMASSDHSPNHPGHGPISPLFPTRVATTILAGVVILILLGVLIYAIYGTYFYISSVPPSLDLELGDMVRGAPRGMFPEGDCFQDQDHGEDANELFEIGSDTDDGDLSDDDDDDAESVSSLLPGLRSPVSTVEEEEEEEEEQLPDGWANVEEVVLEEEVVQEW